MPHGHNLLQQSPGPGEGGGVFQQRVFRYLTFELFYKKIAISKFISDEFWGKRRGGTSYSSISFDS